MKIIFALAAVIIVSACNIEGGTTQSVSASPPSAAASAQGATTAAQAAILRRPQKCGASTASGRSQAACPSEQEFEAAFGRCYHIVGFARTKAEAEEIVRQTHDQQSGSGAYRMVDGRYGVSYRMSGPRLVMDRHLFSNAVYGPRTIHWHIDRRKNARPSSSGRITRSDEACVPVNQVAGRTDWNFDHITQARVRENRAAREQARREAAARPRAPVTFNPNASCFSSDTCFRVLETNGSSVQVMCTKGPNVGVQKCIATRDGKWAAGCGLADTFAYHWSSMRSAGNTACGG